MLLRYTLTLFLLTGISALVNRYNQWLSLPPVSIHQWRQADGEATVWHYAQGQGFGEPAIFNLFYADDNRAVGEFPVLYWLAGAWQRCMPHPAYPLRWIGLALMLFGAWVFGWMALRYCKHPVLAALFGVLLANAPILAYYSLGFLPDAPAFWCAILMLGCLWKAEENQQPRWLLLAAMAGTLAILLKISLAILPIALGLCWARGRWQGRWSAASLWSSPWPAVALAGSAFAVFSVRWWISAYNAAHHTGYFLATTRPVWDYDAQFIRETLALVLRSGLPVYANAGLYAALMAGVWLLWKHWKSLPVFLRELLVWCSLGSLGYFLLWFRMFREHDYYVVCLWALPALVLLAGLKFARQYWPDEQLVRVLSFLWLLGLLHTGYVMRKRLDLAFYPKNTLSLPPVAFLPNDALTEAGIPASARFLCPEDPSPNIALLALQRHGWTAYNFGDRITADTLAKYQAVFGLSHLALRDTALYTQLYRRYFHIKLRSTGGWHWYAR